MNTSHSHPALTKNQSLVLNVLSEADGPLSAYTILDRLRDDGFRAPLQVYRALDKLQETGLVHRLESLNAFVVCTHDHRGHDHDHANCSTAFAICDNCSRVIEFSGAELDTVLGGLMSKKGFRSTKTTIEMHGLCEDCAKN
ncbi:Fur family transcriptional regulator [Limoniibacter endophyticus]|uniref:Fur family transcriptional regulator n=1 Tax=Limoniibacter endophyticus TaxID=1565040 RepID=A0A8J3DG32_9HYPH|nr:Fur family transcriptional regulator [Limoniibacter endophyticus]GHC67948.1 Fur family transcriptional regulator [Limoniibacter endophyticus]